MKRWLSVLLLLCMLCGCADTTNQTPDTDLTEPPTQDVTQPPTVAGLLDSGNPAGNAQPEALKAYGLPWEDCTGMAAMGSDLLIFREDRLVLLTDPYLETYTEVEVPGLPALSSGLVQVRQDGVAYYDRKESTVVFLGSNLRESMRLHLPEDANSDAWLSSDWNAVYYCTESHIRVLDIKTGISRLLKEQGDASYTINDVLLDGALLRCKVTFPDGTEETEVLSTQTGELLCSGDHLNTLTTGNGMYFSLLDRGIAPEWVFGAADGDVMNLCTAKEVQNYWVLWQDGSVVTVRYVAEGAILERYDLQSGLRDAAVFLTGVTELEEITTAGKILWLRSGQAVYRWDMEKTPTGDKKVYTAKRYTQEQPDTEGLAALQGLVEGLEQKYQIELLIWNEATDVAPWDYVFETEFVPRAYERAVALLDRVMANFPPNFFTQAAERSANGKLTIVLVRGIYGSAEMGTLSSAEGVQYWHENGNVYIALRTGKELERYFYHEMAHLIDTRVLSKSAACYEWDRLNPPGFQYDGSYLTNIDRQDTQYLQPGNQWFIDLYSMSFPVEDRARILEYASLPGNEAYFTSTTMQEKLRRVCRGIREAFQLEASSGTFIWEQYLQ